MSSPVMGMPTPGDKSDWSMDVEISMDVNDEDIVAEIPKPEDGSDGCMDVDDADIVMEMLMLEEKSEWGMDVDDEDVVVENMPVEQAMQGIVDLEVFDEDIQMHA